VEQQKKYELTGTKIVSGDRTFYQIRALRSFSNPNYGEVLEGEYGGFVEHEDNLSHEGNCWVSCVSIVSENARVSDSAIVQNEAQVYGNAEISGNAIISDGPRILDNAIVSGNAVVCGYVVVHSNAVIEGNTNLFGFFVTGAHLKEGNYDRVIGSIQEEEINNNS
jgi:acetyltransferase-like isoleucine patch superfamily enzyme